MELKDTYIDQQYVTVACSSSGPLQCSSNHRTSNNLPFIKNMPEDTQSNFLKVNAMTSSWPKQVEMLLKDILEPTDVICFNYVFEYESPLDASCEIKFSDINRGTITNLSIPDEYEGHKFKSPPHLLFYIEDGFTIRQMTFLKFDETLIHTSNPENESEAKTYCLHNLDTLEPGNYTIMVNYLKNFRYYKNKKQAFKALLFGII